MARYTLIQSGDFNAAENIGALAGDIQREGIVSGLGLSGFDASVPEIDVSAGKTVHLIDSQTAEATLDDGTTVSEQRDQIQLISHVDPQTVGLVDNAINELYLTPQPAVDDSPNVVATTTGDPTPDALKIGEIDTTNNTVSEQWNLIRADGTLSYPDVDAATTALQSLPTGVTVIDRDTGTQISDADLDVPSIAVDSISGSSLTDQITDTQLDTSSGFFTFGSNDARLDSGQAVETPSAERVSLGANTILSADDGTREFLARNDDTAVGRLAGNGQTNETAIGYKAARDNTGDEVTATGREAARNNTGNRVTATGRDAARDNTRDRVTATGYDAARNNTGANVTATGYFAARGNTGNFVTATGLAAAENNTGDFVTATGFDAASGNSGNGVIAIGHEAAQFNSENDIMIITDQNGNRRMELDLDNGNLRIDGSLNQNASI